MEIVALRGYFLYTKRKICIVKTLNPDIMPNRRKLKNLNWERVVNVVLLIAFTAYVFFLLRFLVTY